MMSTTLRTSTPSSITSLHKWPRPSPVKSRSLCHQRNKKPSVPNQSKNQSGSRLLPRGWPKLRAILQLQKNIKTRLHKDQNNKLLFQTTQRATRDVAPVNKGMQRKGLPQLLPKSPSQLLVTTQLISLMLQATR